MVIHNQIIIWQKEQTETGTNISCAKNAVGLVVETSLADAVARFRSLAYTI